MTSIFSFIHDSLDMKKIEVEVSLIPGLPQFQIMGLPDTVIRESHLRIKSALKAQGFTVPTHQQVLVNLKPAHIKKRSAGLDLAIAYAYLLETGQIQPIGDKVFVYGELSLNGDIGVSDEFLWKPIIIKKGEAFISAEESKLMVNTPYYGVNHLRDLHEMPLVQPKNSYQLKKPPFLKYQFKFEAAELMSMVALGGHSLFLAGPAGSGKTTVCQGLHLLQEDPNFMEFSEIQKIAQYFGQEVSWRPFVSPHHTTPHISLIGGGVPPFPGEITRACGGTLLLDEFLEFSSMSQEALREPIQSGEIVVSRRGNIKKYPAAFHLLATSNLCKCGDLVPDQPKRCSYSLARCRAYIEKMSGPVMDRFDILSFTHKWLRKRSKFSKKTSTLQESCDDKNSLYTLEDIFNKVIKARRFIRKNRNQEGLNKKLDVEGLELQVDSFIKNNLLPDFKSYRRKQSFYQVARSLADLCESEAIELEHLEKARKYSIDPFLQIGELFH